MGNEDKQAESLVHTQDKQTCTQVATDGFRLSYSDLTHIRLINCICFIFDPEVRPVGTEVGTIYHDSSLTGRVMYHSLCLICRLLLPPAPNLSAKMFLIHCSQANIMTTVYYNQALKCQ